MNFVQQKFKKEKNFEILKNWKAIKNHEVVAEHCLQSKRIQFNFHKLNL